MGQLHMVAMQPSKDEPPISVEALIKALKARTQFMVMRVALRIEKLPLGQSWADVIANAEERTTQGERFREFLTKYYAESTITGGRYVQLYEITDDETELLLAQMEGAVANSDTFGATYPLPLAQNLLLSAPSDPELCEVRKHPNGDVSLIFCSTRSHDEKIAYEAKELPSDILMRWKGIDKLVTYRKIYYQAYDVVTLRSKLNRIEICIDNPTKTKSVDLEASPLKTLSACALHMAGFKGMGAKPPQNLFPAIAGMYYESKEGKVTSLAFRTTTGSIKKERMTIESDDLRDEKFHHAGMNALGQKISPYELTLDYDCAATLKLSAMIRELSSATPTLHGCYVTSISFNSFEHALNRLVTYLH